MSQHVLKFHLKKSRICPTLDQNITSRVPVNQTYEDCEVGIQSGMLNLAPKWARFGLKMGQIGPKCEKFGIFQMKFQYILALTEVWSWANLTHIWPRSDMTGVDKSGTRVVTWVDDVCHVTGPVKPHWTPEVDEWAGAEVAMTTIHDYCDIFHVCMIVAMYWCAI